MRCSIVPTYRRRRQPVCEPAPPIKSVHPKHGTRPCGFLSGHVPRSHGFPAAQCVRDPLQVSGQELDVCSGDGSVSETVDKEAAGSAVGPNQVMEKEKKKNMIK